MENSITIHSTKLPIKEYKGQRVVTFKEIDTVHGRPDGTARKRFNSNRKHFIEGVDFFNIQMSEKRTLGFDVPNRGLILVTESGYLMLVKSFTDDLAWEVQRDLVNNYFRIRVTVLPEPPATTDRDPKYVTTDDAIVALEVLRFVKNMSEIHRQESGSRGDNGMVQSYNSEIIALNQAIKTVGMLVAAGY